MNVSQQGAAGAPAPEDIVEFWRVAGRDKWFARDEEFDVQIRELFLPLHEKAARGELAHWEETPTGALTLVLLLDQFPRNMFRGKARAYQTDEAALALAERALDKGHDRATPMELRRFFYMPYMHAEDMENVLRSETLFKSLSDEEGVHYARLHVDLIDRFGRFPHRNEALGRKTTTEEQGFIDQGGYEGWDEAGATHSPVPMAS